MAMVASVGAVPMQPSAAFGVQGSLKDGVQFLEELAFVSVASHCVAERNLADVKAPGRFITGNSTMCGISAMAVSQDRRNLAFAEIAKLKDLSSTVTAGPIISVYAMAKLIKRRSLMSVAVGSREYVSLDFTCDGKHIAALGGPPEWQLQLWNIMGIRVVGSVRTVTLNSTAAYQTYKMMNNALREVSTDYRNQEGRKVLCHTWIPPPVEDEAEDEEVKDKEKDTGKGEDRKSGKAEDKGKSDKPAKKSLKGKKPSANAVVDCGCVYALDSGELLYVNNGEVLSRIPMGSSEDEVCVAHTIVPYSKGLICGESGAVSVYDYDRALRTYRRVRSVKVEETNARVCGLTLSLAEDVLMCLLASNSLIHFSFNKIDTLSAGSISSKVHTQSYHQAFITGMDTCLLKPFVVTCSKDNSVRVWNYEEQSCEILKFFPSEALSVAMHPSGLYLLVGFLDCLYLFDMLISDLRSWREFPLVKGCTNCAFSRGGQYFAASSGNSVYIINSYTGYTIGHLRAHLNKVQSIWWAYDDFSIVTAGMDGAIYEWDLKTCKRSRENVIKGCLQTCVICVKDSKLLLSTASDCKLRELDDVEVFRTIESNVNLTQIVHFVEGSLVFAGTEHGAIRAYRYPLSGVFHELKVFAASVVKVCLSTDNRLFCASGDGLMMMFDVRMPGPQRAARANVVSWCNEVLISRADLKDYIHRVLELEAKVVDTEKHCEYEIKYNNEQLAGKIRDLENHYYGLLDEARAKHQTLFIVKAEMELELERKQNLLQTIHAEHIQDMEGDYCKKMMLEISRYDDAVRRKKEEDASWTQQMESMSKAHELAVQELIEAYEAKLEDTKEELHNQEMKKGQIAMDIEQVRNVTEEDADHEFEVQKEMYENMLKEADEKVRQIMGENGLLKSKFIKFQKEVDESYSELQNLLSQKKELYEIINGCQRDIQWFQKDLVQRDETLKEKDTRIYDLKRGNQELEKFRWVLDFKIKDLVRSIGPSHIESAELRDKMEKMEDELLSAHDQVKIKDELIANLNVKLKAVAADRKHIMFASSRQIEQLKDFQADYHKLSQKIENIQGLKLGIIEIYRKHVEGKLKLEKVDKPLREEAFHQVDTLERQVKTLECKLKKEKQEGFRSQVRRIKENQYLIFQSKEMREDIRSRTQTPRSSAPGSRMASRPTTSDGKELASLRKQLAELQLQLSAESARVELLEEHIASKRGDSSAGLRHCMGVKKMPLARR